MKNLGIQLLTLDRHADPDAARAVYELAAERVQIGR
jgi:hypothetical protein